MFVVKIPLVYFSRVSRILLVNIMLMTAAAFSVTLAGHVFNVINPHFRSLSASFSVTGDNSDCLK